MQHLAAMRAALPWQLACAQLFTHRHRAQQQAERHIPAKVRVWRHPRCHLQRVHELMQRTLAKRRRRRYRPPALLLAQNTRGHVLRIQDLERVSYAGTVRARKAGGPALEDRLCPGAKLQAIGKVASRQLEVD